MCCINFSRLLLCIMPFVLISFRYLILTDHYLVNKFVTSLNMSVIYKDIGSICEYSSKNRLPVNPTSPENGTQFDKEI